MKISWQTKKLGDITSIIKGRKPKDLSNTGNIPYLTARAIRGFEDFEFVSEKQLSECVIVKEDDIVIIMDGSNSGELFSGLKGVLASTMGIIKTEKEFVDSRYLMHFLLTYRDAFTKARTGSAIPHLNKVQFDSLEIPLLPLSEQKRIVKILDEAFEKLEKAKENTEKNLQNSKELFESYLNDIFSNPSKDWEHGTVSSFVRQGYISKPQDGNHGEIHPHRSDYVSDGVPFIMACDLINGGVDQINSKFISEKLAKSLRIGFAKNEDVLLSHKGTIGRVAILETDKPFVILTPQITYYRILDKSKIYNKFLYYYFLSNRFQSEMQKIAGKGSTRAYIGITKQEELSLLVPSLTEQKQIVKKLDQLSEKTQKLETLYKQKIESIKELKKSILSQVFSKGI